MSRGVLRNSRSGRLADPCAGLQARMNNASQCLCRPSLPGMPVAAAQAYVNQEKMMKTIWVVVADEAIARILCMPQKGGQLEPVEELTDPTAHASGSDLRRDA